MKTRAWVVIFGIIAGGIQGSLAEIPDTEALGRELRQEALSGRTGAVEALVRLGADVNSRGAYGESALYNAALFGHGHTLERLLELGAHPDVMNERNRTPLLRAVEDCNLPAVRALVKWGAKITHRDDSGRDALIEAADSDCVQVTAFLLEKGRGKINLLGEDASFRNARDYAQNPWVQLLLDRAMGRADDTPVDGEPNTGAPRVHRKAAPVVDWSARSY